MPCTVYMTRNQRLDHPEIQGRTKYNWQNITKFNEMIPNDIPDGILLYSQINAWSIRYQRGFLGQQMGAAESFGHNSDGQTSSLHQVPHLGDQGRRGRKTIGIGGDGGHQENLTQ